MSATTTRSRTDLGAEIATVGDLLRQAETATMLIEQLQLMAQVPQTWAAELPERLAAAKWQVEAVTRAGGHCADAAADLTALGEHVAALQTACTAAAATGADLAAHGAEGEASALQRD